ncbi:MAG: hypothetical protein ACE10K_09260 [Rhodothermales bacterium]
MKENEFSYEEWLKSVPDSLTGDPLWRMKVYRLALFVADLGWYDVTKLLLKIIPEERTRMIREVEVPYRVNVSNEDAEDLLNAIPLSAP